MSNANLLNARVRRLDGTLTHITKVNANGYSTDAKGPQIPVKRIVQAGKMLKEIEQPFGKDECVLAKGICVKLTKRQQRELAEDTLDWKAMGPDLDNLVFIEPATGKPAAAKSRKGLKAVAQKNKEPKVKKAEKVAAKNELKDDLDFLDERQSAQVNRKAELAQIIDATIADANTKDRRKLLCEAFSFEWKQLKATGGKGVIKHLGRKAAQSAVDKLKATVTHDAFVKQMPVALKRLIQDRRLVLNKMQIERVLSALGLDVAFYDIAMQTLLGSLSLALDDAPAPDKEKPAKAKKVKAAKATYVSEKEEGKRVRKMTMKLIKPPKSELKAAKAHMRQAKETIAAKMGITVKEVKRGLKAYRSNGTELMFVACDLVGPVFVEKDGTHLQFNYANLGGTFDLTAAPASELDAKA